MLLGSLISAMLLRTKGTLYRMVAGPDADLEPFLCWVQVQSAGSCGGLRMR